MKKLLILFAVVLLSGQYSNASATTDYFRSAANGDWTTLATWQSSADNISWAAATLIPTHLADTIYIRNGHTVEITTNQILDQVVIENGGILTHLGFTLTVNDGPGDDILVQSGGAFTLASDANAPVFSPSTANANITTGGTLRLSATGLAFPDAGVNASNYIYRDSAVLEYTMATPFATSNVVFFPNVNATTIPILRTTQNVGNVGANTATTINGLFEPNGNITFQGTGIKTFRNGIIGTGNINASGSGKFLINGTTAKFGGSGTLIVSAGLGMDIGASTTVTMLSDKVMTGNITLLPSNSLIILGNFNLDITAGSVNGGSATSHVVTNGSGKLIYNFITGPVKIYPIGATTTTINPIAISNGGGFNYGARVEVGINPNIVIPLEAVNRTWFVTATGGDPGTVNTNFFYNGTDANSGFDYTADVELGHHTGVWNVIQTGLIPAGSYQVATSVSTFGNNIEAPLVLANLGAILTAHNSVDVDYFTGFKQNGVHLLQWKLRCSNTSRINTVLERSNNASDYTPIYREEATALRCEQPFQFNDHKPAWGVNYYRLKMTDDGGRVFYSPIVNLINTTQGMELMNIAPNPVMGGSFNLRISAAQRTRVKVVVSDMPGRIIQTQTGDLIAGYNSLAIDVSKFAKGSYQLTVQGPDKISVFRFVVQ